MMCEQCGIEPCACEYIKSLMPGGRNERLAEVAKAMVREPLPHRGGEGSCPCPLCWAERARRMEAWAEREWQRIIRANTPWGREALDVHSQWRGELAS